MFHAFQNPSVGLMRCQTENILALAGKLILPPLGMFFAASLTERASLFFFNVEFIQYLKKNY